MRALSLTQPWASLVAIGAKQWETRSWATGYRGQIAIHAAKAYPRWARDLERVEPFRSALRPSDTYRYPPLLSCGCIVALASITDCRRTAEFVVPHAPNEWTGGRGVLVGGDELSFGDYSAGRFAFRLENVLPLRFPVPCRGALGIWQVPDGVVAQIADEIEVGR
jgi:hypothetical protein